MSTELDEMTAFAHAVKPCLIELGAQFTKPVQGEASHKVIGWNARRALKQVAWWVPQKDQDHYAAIGMDAIPGGGVPIGALPLYIVVDPDD